MTEKYERRLMDLTQTADFLGIKKGTLYAWVNRRKIPYVKVGRLLRFDSADMDAWVQINKVKVAEF